MDQLFIEGNLKCPTISLNKSKGIFCIEGRSVPEDAQKFYLPITNWFKKYEEDPNESTIMVFKLDYFNTASSMMLLAILLSLKAISKQGHEVLVQWHFDEEDIKDSGIDYEEATGLPFEFFGEIDESF